MDCNQRAIDKIFQTLVVCLQPESLIRDESIYLLQNSKINSNAKNLDQSKLSATHDNKAIHVNNAPLDKDNRESIDDNSCNDKCDEISDHELSNKIAIDNGKNRCRIKKNHQNNTNNFNNLRTIQYNVSKNDKNDENVRKQRSKKRVYIVRDRIVGLINGYGISCKTENSKVFVRGPWCNS